MAGNIYGYMPSGSIHDEVNTMSRRQILKRVLVCVRPYSALIVLSLFLAVISTVCMLLVPIRIGNAIDYAIEMDNRLLPTLKISGVLVIVAGVSLYLMNLLNNHIVYNTVMNVRNQAFDKIMRFPVSYVDSRNTGDIVSRMIADTDQFADGLLMGFTQMFTGVITIVGTLIFMFRLNITIALIVVLVTPLSLFVAKFITDKTFHMFKKQNKERGEQTALIDEVLTNEKVVKVFRREELMLSRFDTINDALRESSFRAVYFSSLTNPSTRLVSNIVYALVAGFGAIAVSSNGTAFFGKLSIGILTCFLSYANQYMKPFNEIASVVTEFQNALSCAARIFEVVDEKEFDGELKQTLPSELINENTGDFVAKGEVKARHISFGYETDKDILKDIDFDACVGERIAIVGPTGCGKTTFINLLMRFYDANRGQLLYDGRDSRTISIHDVRSSFGMVLQDTWLFSGSIRDNITFGRKNATDEEMIIAAKEAHAHSFIMNLPNGYDTMIGEAGGLLSQGQKQLICIARIMLLKPPMLILDEATSSIDTRTEMNIQKAFASLMNGRTTFIVAHRLSTIADADRIFVMKDGRIIEQGKHRELLAQNGFYAKLYRN